MAKFFELPTEQSICCIPLKHAVYCRACRTVSNSRPHECGLCGSRKVMRLEAVLSGNPDPPAQGCRAAGISLVTAVGACRRHSASRGKEAVPISGELAEPCSASSSIAAR